MRWIVCLCALAMKDDIKCFGYRRVPKMKAGEGGHENKPAQTIGIWISLNTEFEGEFEPDLTSMDNVGMIPQNGNV